MMSTVFPASTPTLSGVRLQIRSLQPRITLWRRQIHQQPELAFTEAQTAAFISQKLTEWGIEHQREVAKTGIVAVIAGQQPGPVLAIRADMDALPIHELNEVDYRSQRDGIMHACGHDLHTSSLLGTALILSRLREHIPGTIHFVFQPSEERLPGGAHVMIEEGLFEKDLLKPAPAAIYGQHVQPDLEVGKIGVRSGMYMASADEVYVTVHGEGGHAAGPHRLRADAVVAAAHVIVALQTVISRNCPPDVPSILTLGRLHADGATNVIPETARMEGTFRAMDEEWRFRAHDLIRRVAEHAAAAQGARAEVEIVTGYPALENEPASAERVRKAAESYVGPENVIDLDYWFASEDFAWYLKELPGAFYRIGTRSAGGPSYGLHTSRLMLDEEALRTAPGFMAHLAITHLNEHE